MTQYIKYLLLIIFTTIGASNQIFAEPQKTGINKTFMQDNNKGLTNPGMGWIIYYYANSLKYYAKDIEATDVNKYKNFPGLKVVYFRLAWSYLEPEEGKYKWELIDGPAKKFIDMGLKIAIRVSTSENLPDQPYATPKWVFDAGSKSHRFIPGHPGKLDEENGKNYEPVFNDPIYLTKLNNFLKAFAKKYDGNTEIEFIDVGSFGVYGEGHTYSSTKVSYPASVIKKHIDMHVENFPKTLLVANHNFADHLQNGIRDINPIEYAQSKGLAFRDDSILIMSGEKAFYDHKMAEIFYKTKPTILETGEYSSRIKSNLWNEKKIMESIEKYHASYFGAYWSPLPYLEKNINLINKINLRLGYRIQIPTIAWDYDNIQKKILFKYEITNSGVAPCLTGGFVTISIKDTNDNLKKLTIDNFNVSNLETTEVNDHIYKNRELSLITSDLKPGNYKLFISVGDQIGNPKIELPYNNSDAQKRYFFGNFIVK